MYFFKKKQMWIFTPQEKEAAHNISILDYLERNYGLKYRCNLGLYGDDREGAPKHLHHKWK